MANNNHSYADTNNSKIISDFLAALNSGKVCLHPTDTIPGLTFHPQSPKALENIYKIKDQRQGKQFISLVDSFAMAKSMWEPLPSLWEKALSQLWPNTLTVIWKARDKSKSFLCDSQGHIALRYPDLAKENSWLYEVIKTLNLSLPSTSVNESLQLPLTSWEKAKEFCDSNYIFVPNILKQHQKSVYKPSTLIKIHEDTSYTLIREGIVSKQDIETYL